MSVAATTRTALRTCPLCEATCGLELTIEGERITRIRGDKDHVFSKGFICPKGAAFGQLVEDPDRLRRPLIREGADWREADWPEAFAAVEAGLRTIVERDGSQALAVYVGNPSVHNMAGALYLSPFLRALQTRNFFSAATVDQIPKHVSCGYMFGDPLAFPVPDLDRTDFLLILGANPWESNGSLCTAPDFRGRVKAIQARGGRCIVVDPRRTRTAAEADEHIFIRPGTDALFLLGMANVLFEENLVAMGTLGDHVEGVERIRAVAAGYPPERVAATCAIPAVRIRALARELAAAPTAAVYGRVGTSTVEFGTVASWLVDVLNVLTGNLDRPGGAMFPLAAHLAGGPKEKRDFTIGHWQSRVRALPEVFNQLPVAALAEEIDTPGEEQVRAFITFAGNPVLSTPNSGRLDAALASLEFMVSIDPYINETSRHANVILPPTDAARVGHFDFAFLGNAIRNYASYSPPVLPPDEGAMDDGDILLRITLIARGEGAEADLAAAHELLLMQALERIIGDRRSPVFGRDPAELRPMVTGDGPLERQLDVKLRVGAYGEGFGANPDGLSLQKLLDNPHGVDLGALQPRVPEILRTTSSKIDLAPEPILADLPRLEERLTQNGDGKGLVLVGRRHLRSNNSWMHNVPMLMTGKEDRCLLQVHPDDARRLTLDDGGHACITSRAGSLEAIVEVTDEVMPGVVSLPHGWGHNLSGTRLAVAEQHAGVNSNILADELAVDPLSGNAVFNGIPVQVEAIAEG